MIKICGQVITFVDESRKSGQGCFGGEIVRKGLQKFNANAKHHK
jgi:hypothetical protein